MGPAKFGHFGVMVYLEGWSPRWGSTVFVVIISNINNGMISCYEDPDPINV